MAFVWIILLSACSPRHYAPLVKEVHDTTYLHRIDRDSVYVRDSIFIRERAMGDTVYIERTALKYLYRNLEKTDTVYRDRVEYEEVEVVREVEKSLTPWQQIKMGSFWMLALLALVGFRKELWRLFKTLFAPYI